VKRAIWTNIAFGTIGRANLDGTGVNQNFITADGNVTGIATDGSDIYWGNEGTNAIGRANLDGTGVNHAFIMGASSPFYLAAIPEPASGLLVMAGVLGLAIKRRTSVASSLGTLRGVHATPPDPPRRLGSSRAPHPPFVGLTLLAELCSLKA
jgi:hypothetical protein